MTEWVSLAATLGLIGVTVWYAVQTQRMAKSAQVSALSAERAAGHSARSAAIAAAGTEVDFWISPTYAIEAPTGAQGHWFTGVRIECRKAAVYLHAVHVESVWAPDPDLFDIEPSLTEVEIYREGEIPPLLGLPLTPVLLHKGEFEFLDFPLESWTESDVAALTVVVDYSFDASEPTRSRRLEWIGQPGRDYGPYPAEGE